MFTDETLDLIAAESTWRKSHQQTQESRSCQTLPVHTAEAETQAKDVLDNSTQTQEQISQTLSLDQNISHFPGLLDFLHRAEDVVTKELLKNSKSHAFDGFEVNWEDQNECPACTVFSMLMLRKGVCKSPVCPGTAPAPS
uniref:Uncharacterized protein n=1 Tax=Sinocyclocheilus grahami TaxID=75366 RepID=A0A672L8K3_SINGR